MSKECFYAVVERATADHAGIMLGLRAEESRGRSANRASRGPLYRRACGQWTSTPIVDWSGLDVFAYLAARDIGLLPVYRCIGLDPRHAAAPWRVRKSWWLPGSHSSQGATAWLRHYWPSLHSQLCDWMPDASLHS